MRGVAGGRPASVGPLLSALPPHSVSTIVVAVVVLLTGGATRPSAIIVEPMVSSLPKKCPHHVLMAYAEVRRLIDFERYPWWGPRVPCEHPLWWQRIQDWPEPPTLGLPRGPMPEFPPLLEISPTWPAFETPPIPDPPAVTPPAVPPWP